MQAKQFPRFNSKSSDWKATIGKTVSWELNKIYKIQSLKTYQKKTDASTTNCNIEQRVFGEKKKKKAKCTENKAISGLRVDMKMANTTL